MNILPRKKEKEKQERQGEGGAPERSGGAGGSNTTRAERAREFGVTTALGAKLIGRMFIMGSNILQNTPQQYADPPLWRVLHLLIGDERAN